MNTEIIRETISEFLPLHKTRMNTEEIPKGQGICREATGNASENDPRSVIAV